MSTKLKDRTQMAKAVYKISLPTGPLYYCKWTFAGHKRARWSRGTKIKYLGVYSTFQMNDSSINERAELLFPSVLLNNRGADI